MESYASKNKTVLKLFFKLHFKFNIKFNDKIELFKIGYVCHFCFLDSL